MSVVEKVKGTLSWWDMTSIQIGGAICMPVLMIGEQLGRAYGFGFAAAAILIGNGLLFILGMFMANMSFDTKANTVENARSYLGTAGIWLLAFNMIISLTGWFAIQLNLISLSIIKGVALICGYNLSVTLVNILLGTLIVLVALFGIKALIRLADITMPLLVGTLIYAIYNAWAYGISAVAPIQSSLHGISLVFATAIMAVIDIPTYYRFARTRIESFVSIGLLFLIVLPVLQLIGVYIVLHSGGNTLVDVLTNGGGLLWQLWVLFFLVFAGWTTNNANLYSATIALQTLFPRISYIICTLIIGGLGIVASCFDLLSSFESVLTMMSMMISAIGGVIVTSYIIDFFTKNERRNGKKLKSLAACFIGCIGGFLSFFEYMPLTGFALIDAFVIAGISIVVMTIIEKILLIMRKK